MNIIKLNATDSTNNYLKQLLGETAVEDQTVILAEHQTSGRGQMGNGWVSRRGQSLTFSLFKRMEGVAAEQQFIISMAVSLAVAQALNTLGIPKIAIKWPNDILSGNKKVVGILIENVVDNTRIKHSVVGVGINVNEMGFPNLPQASSLKLELGQSLSMDEVLMTALECIFENLQKVSRLSFSQWRNLYENQMFRKDAVSVFSNAEGDIFNGIIRGISEMGELLVETESGGVQKFQLKQIKLIF